MSEKTAHAVPKEERMTTPYMTKYEKAKLLGIRALQISMNAPGEKWKKSLVFNNNLTHLTPTLSLSLSPKVMVDVEGETDALQIAMKELRQRKIPLMIRRHLPSGWYEDWGADELIVD